MLASFIICLAVGSTVIFVVVWCSLTARSYRLQCFSSVAILLRFVMLCLLHLSAFSEIIQECTLYEVEFSVCVKYRKIDKPVIETGVDS